MFFRHAQPMNPINKIHLIQLSSTSLILRKGKVPALFPQGRYYTPPITKILNRLATVTTITTNHIHRKVRVLSRVHGCPVLRAHHADTAAGHTRCCRRTSFFTSFSVSGHVSNPRPVPFMNFAELLPGLRRRMQGMSRNASLTVEAALELPIFFVLIAIVLQYACVMRTAAQYSGALATTAQEMAIAAYKEEYGDANNIIRGALSDAWASSQVISKAEDKDAVRLASFLNSSYMKDGDLIRLVLSYQPKPKYSLITLPFTFFVQKAVVRGWVGKDGYSGRKKEEKTEDEETVRTVYVTEHGSVYHTDPNCSHLKVTIIPISDNQLPAARNVSGAKYKKCPYCGRGGDGCHYYVDPYGTCYHTSLDCPGLKRTVHEMDLDECGHMHECKDCRKARGG